jgi:hypothetical protein
VFSADGTRFGAVSASSGGKIGGSRDPVTGSLNFQSSIGATVDIGGAAISQDSDIFFVGDEAGPMTGALILYNATNNFYITQAPMPPQTWAVVSPSGF